MARKGFRVIRKGFRVIRKARKFNHRRERCYGKQGSVCAVSDCVRGNLRRGQLFAHDSLVPIVDNKVVPRRSLSDPKSLVGATQEELLALKPPGWLVRPLPGGSPGFRMISPGTMPGSQGTVTYYSGGSSSYLCLPAKPEPWLFVLNCAVEHELLAEILAAWAPPAGTAGSASPDIPRLADAAQRLVRDGLVDVYRDPLDTDDLVLLPRNDAVTAVADPQNWWRDDSDPATEPASSVFALSITGKGRKVLASTAQPRRRRPWRRWFGSYANYFRIRNRGQWQ